VDRQGALQTTLASGAKATGHRAAHLATHTDGEAISGGDAHRFDAEAIFSGQQQLGGAIKGIASVQQPGAAKQGTAGLQVISVI
jgi:hypothetical protein